MKKALAIVMALVIALTVISCQCTSNNSQNLTEPAVDSNGYLSATISGTPYLNRIHKVGFDLTNYTKCHFVVEAVTASNGNANKSPVINCELMFPCISYSPDCNCPDKCKGNSLPV